MHVIEVSEYKKSFGPVQAVDGITFHVEAGEMFGLVGPDGAGKTTTIRTLCGLTSPDAGSIAVLQQDVIKARQKIRNEIGYLSQKFSLYGDLSIDENLAFFAEIHGVRDFKKRRDELLDFVRLKPFRDRYADRLSGGMKQKLALACSLIHTPRILFLDEPTTGVDPVSRRDFWKILSNLQQQGITIVMATPYLDEAERCTRVALMHNGRLIDIDTPANLKTKTGIAVLEVSAPRIRDVAAALKAVFDYDIQLFGDRVNILVPSDEMEAVRSRVTEVVEGQGVQITSMRTLVPSLENVFIHAVSYGQAAE